MVSVEPAGMKTDIHGSTFIANTCNIRRSNRNHIHRQISFLLYSALAGACKYSIGKGESGFNMVDISIYRKNHFGESKCSRKEMTGMEKIDRLYALLERNDIDENTKAALRWAIFELENAT